MDLLDLIPVKVEGLEGEMIQLWIRAEDLERAKVDPTFLRELVDKEKANSQYLETLENNNDTLETLENNNDTLETLENNNDTLETLENNNGSLENNNDTLETLENNNDTLETLENNNDTLETQDSVFLWTDQCVSLLLALYEEHEGQFSTGAKRHKKIWETIASRMESAGYSVKWSQCQSKLNSLKRRYKTILDHNNKSGNDRKTWIHFDKLQEMFGKTGWATPIAIATEAGPATSQGETRKETPKNTMKRKTALEDYRAEKQKRYEERAGRFEKLMAQKEQQHREKMELMKLLVERLANK